MSFQLSPFTKKNLENYLCTRDGETKFGEEILVPKAPFPECLSTASKQGARFALLGVPEDIGQRGNLGRGGAEGTWDAFLSAFLNTQSNKFLSPESCFLLGNIHVRDLMDQSQNASTEELRSLCAELDERVAPVIQAVVTSGMEPVVIGGGHNNCYPIIVGNSRALASKIACVNLDAHADFRRLEGRHSGNGFRYAHHEGFLGAYTAIGLHEAYTSEENLSALDLAQFPYITFESTHVRKDMTFDQAIDQTKRYLQESRLPVGMEIDADSIASMPASADSPYGYQVSDVARLIYRFASETDCCYLHLSEGAPKLHPGDGERYVGKTNAFLALSYMQARVMRAN